MKEYEIVSRYLSCKRQLKVYGYGVTPLANGFYINDKKGSLVADCLTIDGVKTYLQALERFVEVEPEPDWVEP